jgi:hypothetical protein
MNATQKKFVTEKMSTARIMDFCRMELCAQVMGFSAQVLKSAGQVFAEVPVIHV